MPHCKMILKKGSSKERVNGTNQWGNCDWIVHKQQMFAIFLFLVPGIHVTGLCIKFCVYMCDEDDGYDICNSHYHDYLRSMPVLT